MLYEIKVKDLKDMLGCVNIIDIRNINDASYGMIPGAVNIEEGILLACPHLYINKTFTYYIYCNTGEISCDVCAQLNAMGYNTINVKGGYMKWISL